MKNISFFNVIKTTVITFFIIGSLFVSSFLLVSFVYFNHKNEPIIYQELEIYRQEEIEKFSSYIKNNEVFILITLKNNQTKEFLIDYANYYYRTLQNSIYLEAINGYTTNYVTINLEGLIAFI